MPNVNRDDLDVHPKLWRQDPRRYLEMAEQYIRENPNDYFGYSCRSHMFMQRRELDSALADNDKVIALRSGWVHYDTRGDLLLQMGRFDEAIAAFDQAEAMAPAEWKGSLGPLYRAHCYAALGNEAAALADCARLPEDFWTPGLYGGTPPGNKQEVIDEIRRRARANARDDGDD